MANHTFRKNGRTDAQLKPIVRTWKCSKCGAAKTRVGRGSGAVRTDPDPECPGVS